MIATINPANGKTLREFPALSQEDVEKKLQLAWTTFHSYRHTPIAERAGRLIKAAEILEAEKRELGALMTTEMGKTLGSAIAEAEKCALGCRYYAENAERFLADEPVATNASRSYVRYQPLGPVLAVMPWNFPFWQVFRFVAPALAAGNTGLLKHASNVPQCALAIEDILHRAGFPVGAFQTLLIEASAVDALLHDDRVVAVTLTGSEPAGRSVAKSSGGQIKKAVLELGGSDPFIVMPSANFEEAVGAAVKARVINNGQSCIAAKRFIVAEGIYEAFEKRFVERMKALKVGDPMAADTDVGPLATGKIREELHDQVLRAVAAGGAAADRRTEASTGRASITSRPCWPMFRDRRRCFARNSSVRWPCCSARAMPTRRLNWPTIRRSAWDPACGRRTQRSRRFSSDGIEAGQVFVNAWWHPIRACRLAA